MTIWLTIAALMLSVVTTAHAEKPKLAVLPLQAQRVAEEKVRILDVLLINEVDGLDKYQVIGSSDVNAMLGLERMKEALGCDDVGCAAEIGGALGVDSLLAGSVSSLGGELIVALKLIDIKAQTVTGRGQATTKDSEDLYRQAMAKAVAVLFGVDAIAAQSPPPTTAASASEEKPWRKHGVSRDAWEKYPAYREAALAANFEPLDIEQWKTKAASRHEDWLVYFDYRSKALDKGSTPVDFVEWIQNKDSVAEEDWLRYATYLNETSDPLPLEEWAAIQNEESTVLLICEIFFAAGTIPLLTYIFVYAAEGDFGVPHFFGAIGTGSVLGALLIFDAQDIGSVELGEKPIGSQTISVAPMPDGGVGIAWGFTF